MSPKPREFLDSDGALQNSFPRETREKLKKLERRISPKDLENLIEAMCRTRPLRLGELACLLRRSAVYLQNTALKRMLLSGRLEFLYSEAPHHPRQAYRASSRERGAHGASQKRPLRATLDSQAATSEPRKDGSSPMASVAEMETLSIGVND